VNPLANYLERTGTPQAAFAARLERLLGTKVHQQQVSRWATGSTPRIGVRYLIAKATRGAVPVAAWPVKPRKSKSAA
jgi:hypothetical protein